MTIERIDAGDGVASTHDHDVHLDVVVDLHDDGSATIRLVGVLCALTAPRLVERLRVALPEATPSLDVDLSGLGLCTTHGADALEHLARLTADSGAGDLRTHGAGRVVARALEVLGTVDADDVVRVDR